MSRQQSMEADRQSSSSNLTVAIQIDNDAYGKVAEAEACRRQAKIIRENLILSLKKKELEQKNIDLLISQENSTFKLQQLET